MKEPEVSILERARVALGVVLGFALCVSSAWLAVLVVELFDLDASLRRIPARFAYLSQLALACSVLWLPVVGAMHALRKLLASRVRYADAMLCLLLAAAVAPPSHRRAQLLTGGTGMLDEAGEMPLRIALTAALVAGYVAVWLVHLALCAPPRAIGQGMLVRVPRLTRFGRPLLFALGAAALLGFAYVASQKLRTYAFLVSFITPGAWLFAASLWYGFLIRSQARPTWIVLSFAFVVGGAAFGLEHETPVRHAKAELGRRGGLAAISEAATRFAPPPRYASLALGPAQEYRCADAAPSRRDPDATLLRLDRERRRNVIWISIDSLRRDALGRSSGGTPITPHLDAFAAESLVFERAVTPYPATLFALGGTLTGLNPSELLLAPPTLADVLQLTAASWDVRAAVWPDVVWFRHSALSNLITRHLDTRLSQKAQRQTDEFIQLLRDARARNKRTFAWLHYYEPHQTLERSQRALGGRVRDRYDALVNGVDQQIGRLFDELRSLGYFEDSLIAIFGDHGEALGELSYYGHHVYLNQFIGDIPLLLHAPGLAPGRTDRAASLTDLAPTLLEWTGVAAPELESEAQSLFEIAATTSPRYTLSEAFPVRGRLLYELVREPIVSLEALRERLRWVQSGTFDYQPKVALAGSRYRLIVNRMTGDEEFYDREADPSEQRELSEVELPEQAAMRRELAAMMVRMSQRIHCRIAALPPRTARATAARDVP